MTKPKRTSIPIATQRRLLMESGLRCAVPQCSGQWPTLQFHHIDENPSNHADSNLLLLCPTHHQMVTSKHIDRKTCEGLKSLVTTLSGIGADPERTKAGLQLRDILAELQANLILFQDTSFQQPATEECIRASDTSHWITYLHLEATFTISTNPFIRPYMIVLRAWMIYKDVWTLAN